MKTWREIESVFRRGLELSKAGKRWAIATVIGIEGSTYRRPGACLLIEEDEGMLGNVSGGCLEEDVRQIALRVLEKGEAEKVHYETGSDEDVLWGLGMGCEGEIDLFVQPGSTQATAVECAVRCFEEAESFTLAIIVDGPDAVGSLAVFRKGSCLEGDMGETLTGALAERAGKLKPGETVLTDMGAYRAFLYALAVPPPLIVCGAGDDSIPLVRYAAEAGFRVYVADHRPAYLNKSRFPTAYALVETRAEDVGDRLPCRSDSSVVIKTRSVLHDESWLAYFADKPVRYIGLLGPKERRKKMLDETGVAYDERIFGPVGLDIGAHVPEQVALSIVAELLAVAASRSPRHLRDREGSIHGA